MTGGTSGQDIEEALKEMKSMQILLNEANTEIQVLRSQGKYCTVRYIILYYSTSCPGYFYAVQAIII